MFDGIDGGGCDRFGPSVSQNAGVTTVRLSGRLDGNGARMLRDGFAALVEQAPNDVIVDLRAVTYLDGAGVGAIAYLFRGLTKRGLKLRLSGAQGQPLRTLRELGLKRLLSAEPIEVVGKAWRWPWTAEARA